MPLNWEPPETEEELKKFIIKRIAILFGAMALGVAVAAGIGTPDDKKDHKEPAEQGAGAESIRAPVVHW